MLLAASISLVVLLIWKSTSMSLASTSFKTSQLLVHSFILSYSTNFLQRSICLYALSSSLRRAGSDLSGSPSPSFSLRRSSNFFLPSFVVNSLLILINSRLSLSFLMLSSDSRWSLDAFVRLPMSRLCGLVRLRCMVSSLEGEEVSRGVGAGYFCEMICEVSMVGEGWALSLSEGTGSMRRDMIEPSSKEQLFREQRVGFDNLRVP